MKAKDLRITRIFIALVMLIGFSLPSCQTEFEVNAKWKETIIVYGLLDPLDSVQEIKINKAFLNTSGSAYEVAQNPDSLYLDSTYATITELETGRLIILHKTKIKKDSGIFANNEAFVWTTKEPILQNKEYRLDVSNPLSGTKVSAKTWTLGKTAIQGPIFEQSLFFSIGTPYVTTAFTPGENSYAFDVKMHMVVESFYTTDTNKKEEQYIKWNMLTNFMVQPRIRAIHQMPRLAFLQFLANSLKADDKKKHRIKWVGFSFHGGNQTLMDYISVNEPSIGIVQKQAEFTNIDNGMGLFASRVEQSIMHVPFDKNSISILQKDSTTKKFNFIP